MARGLVGSQGILVATVIGFVLVGVLARAGYRVVLVGVLAQRLVKSGLYAYWHEACRFGVVGVLAQ